MLLNIINMLLIFNMLLNMDMINMGIKYRYDFWRVFRDPSEASEMYHITFLLAF